MRNENYWANRIKIAQDKTLDRIYDEYVANIERQYNRAILDIEKDILAWYQRFADNNELSFADAQKLLKSDELEEFKWTVQEYIEKGKENGITADWAKELENASARVHISRLESLKYQLRAHAEELTQGRIKNTTEASELAFTEGYYHTAFEFQKEIGVGFSLQSIDRVKLEKILNTPWTVDNQTFTARCWSDKAKLVEVINQELTRMVATGEAPKKTIERVAKQLETSKNNAGRVVMTESAYFATASQGVCYKDLDVENYEVIGTLDSHTCSFCGEMDGKIFPVNKMQAGSTAPPFHPWCRCTTAPYYEYMVGVGQRFARDKDGNTYAVPSDMTYAEWKKKIVDKSAENGIIKIGSERGIDNQMSLAEEKRTVAGNRKSSFYVLNAKDIEYVKSEIVAIGANEEDFVFNSDITRGTCFLASDGKIHIKGNIFPDEYSSHPRDKLSIRAVLAHEYYGHRPYRKQYLAEDNDTSPEAMDRILSRAWADEFRASYMAAKNAPNLTKKDRVLLIQDSLSRAEEAGVTIKYNDFIRRVLYG